MPANQLRNTHAIDSGPWILPPPAPMHEFRDLEDRIIALPPGLLREQLLDALKTNYGDELDRVVEGLDAHRPTRTVTQTE